MSGHVVPAPAGHSDDRRLERWILERLDSPAVVADEVVVMVSARIGALEPRHAVTQVDALHETQLGEAVQGAVDAGDPDSRAGRAHAVVDLLRRQAAVLACEELDHDAAGAPAPSGLRPHASKGARRPFHRHCDDNDTRSQRRARLELVRHLISLCIALSLAGCGGENEHDPSRTIVAAFYPLAWASEQIAEGSYDVVNLTPAGAEPHDVELSLRDVEVIGDAQLVVYAGGGFQPAVEDAVADRDGSSLDVLEGDRDPHVWLDPVRFASVARDLGTAIDRPAAARDLVAELSRLDEAYSRGLDDCTRRTLVTTHAAFGHLATRYRLRQLSLTGSSPEAEPGPRELERLVEDVRASGATTVFAEPLVSDRLAATVAREAGVDVAVLDPLEGLSQDRLEAGEDYLTVMRESLASLRTALGCR